MGSTWSCRRAATSQWSGRSGAGKSTLADVLLRFLPYQSGSVTLDDTPISEL